MVTNYGAETGQFGMITIRGERAYTAIILQGSGNTSVIDAGGVSRVLYIDGGVVTMNGGVIENNSSDCMCGGGIAAVDSVISIKGSAKVLNNKGNL